MRVKETTDLQKANYNVFMRAQGLFGFISVLVRTSGIIECGLFMN